MKNLKVSLKLIVSFLIITVLAITVGVIGIIGMNSINDADDRLYNENVVALSAMGTIREMLQDQRVQLRNMALNAGDSAMVQEYLDTLLSLESAMETKFAEYEATIVNASAEFAYFEAKELYLGEFAGLKREIIEASLEGPAEAHAAIFDPETAEVTAVMVGDFEMSMNSNDKWARETVDGNTALFKTMLLIEIIVLAFAVVVAIFFAFYISGLIAKPLTALAVFMNKAGSTGDLTITPADYEVIGKFSQIKDEIGQTVAGAATFVNHVTTISGELEKIAGGDLTVEVALLSDTDVMGISLKQMLENFNNMFAEIGTSTYQVSTGSKQVAEGAQSLAQGSTEQAASIEELSSSIAEISERTKGNAATADRTSKLSETIKGNAEKGSRQMDDMISAVKDINDASHSISKIIKTIDDIAFQTNILALNAAVEAARAGQHGKGFAVVAEEVRNLASKSAEAARDTGNMIQNSMEKAEFGSQIAEETATSLKDIVTGINETSQLVAEIARASEEQSLAITQINTGIDQVALVIQQNSATAQESAAASEEMSGQSDMLQQLISQFRLREANALVRGLPPGTL